MSSMNQEVKILAKIVVEFLINRELLKYMSHSCVCYAHQEVEPCGACHVVRQKRWGHEVAARLKAA